MGKIECPKCNNIYNSRCFTIHRTTGEKRCYRCINKYGQNKFYAPEIRGAKIKKNSYLSNYSLNLNEKQALYKELINQGCSEEYARRRVNNRTRYINWFQWRKRKMVKNEENKEKIDMKMLVKGLK